MQFKYRLKHQLKLQRWRLRRVAVRLRWGIKNQSFTPAVLGNAMPKSGSHLMFQVIQGLVKAGPFVDPGMPPVNRAEDNGKLPVSEILANIHNMKAGDIAYGYIHAKEPFLSLLCKPGRATIFVYRDPRDMIVSHVFYAMQIHPGHAMHRYYTDVLGSIEDRINAAILGVDEGEVELSSIRVKYDHYLGWLERREVLSMRFEELILDRDAALGRILDYLIERGYAPKMPRMKIIEILRDSIVPKKSGTYRKAQPGNWREYFTSANKTLFKETTGELLVRLGYEESARW
jgi:hypothetical protein